MSDFENALAHLISEGTEYFLFEDEFTNYKYLTTKDLDGCTREYEYNEKGNFNNLFVLDDLTEEMFL